MLRSLKRDERVLETVRQDPDTDRQAEDSDELVQRARDGDVESFNRLVIQHQNAAYGLAYRFLRTREAAEDVTQEAFLRAYKNLPRFRGGRFRSWLLRIVANAARDELRRRKRRPQRSLDEARDDPDAVPLDPPDPGPSPEDVTLQGELRRVLERALGELPDDWRMVVLLSDVHGLSYQEVAESTGLALGTVKSRLSRARARLRDLLRDSGELTELTGRLEERR